jgi:hypothetical protein
VTLRAKEEELTLSGAFVETSDPAFIPDRAIVLGVSSRTTLAITGASSYGVGVVGNTTQFGNLLGSSLNSTNNGVIGPTAFYADTKVRITANGGSFTGGKVRLIIYFLEMSVPTSWSHAIEFWNLPEAAARPRGRLHKSSKRSRRYGVNSGIGRSGKVLRRILRLPDNTSVVTDEVIAAAWAIDPRTLITAICDERLHFLQSLKTWPIFGRGWGRRVADVKSKALEMATDAAKRGVMARN